MLYRKARAEGDGADRRALPFHPLLIAAFPILALYARNAGEVPLGQVLRPLGLAVLGTLLVWAILALLTRQVLKGALAGSATVLAFFSYGHARNLLPAPLHGLIVPCLLVLLAVLLALIVRARGPLGRVTTAVNLASVILAAPSCWAVASALLAPRPPASARAAATGVSQGGAPPAARARRRPPPPPPTRDLPDVYYIVLDAYGRADSLKTFYGYDNEPFLRELEDRGFYVARQSHANYDETPLCLASALNLQYLDGVVRTVGRTSTDPEPLRRMLDENTVAAALRPFGYHYVWIWTGAGQTRTETADLVLDSGSKMTSFEGDVLGLSALDAAKAAHDTLYNRHRGAILAGFRHLDTVARLRYPKFVIAHILVPHPPFIFGPNGEAVNQAREFTFADGSQVLGIITRDEYRAGYVAQLRYTNRRVLEAIDAILRQSRRRPIIIVQGDHGSRMNMDWDGLAGTDVREPFSILNAYLVPDSVRRHLYQSITPVNSFRVLLTNLYGAHYPPLPDRAFYCTAGQPYDLTEVTGMLKAGMAQRPKTPPGAGAPRGGAEVRRPWQPQLAD